MNYQKIAAFFAAIAIALGAFGAHALKTRLEANGMLEAWRTAVLYHLVHAVALYALASAGRNGLLSRSQSLAAGLWCAGIVLFSGSLYGLALTDWAVLGPVTPIGGLCLIAGWVSLLFSRKQV